MGCGLSTPKTAQAQPARLQTGSLVAHGSLRVVKPLGEGSWSDVYLVERMKDGRSYALKRTLISELSEAERWIAVNELRLLASLNHPNVVNYKQGFVEDNCLFVIMEVVPNGDLSKVIEQHRRRETRISEDHIWSYLLQMALGLQHLHASGIVHRDIKPANILVGRDGVLKIADLGVAGLLHMGSSKLQIGTPQYMAPEMHAGHAYGYSADVWSLACLLYELCALEPLFQDCDEEVVARKVLATVLPPAIPAKYSPELQILLNRMMQHDSELRPSIDEVLASPQLMSRMQLLPAELEASLSVSLDCMEGLPVLPAIDIPADLHDLNTRLPPPRFSSDNLASEGALEMAARFGAPAVVVPLPAVAQQQPQPGQLQRQRQEHGGAAAQPAAPQQQQQQRQQQPFPEQAAGSDAPPYLPRVGSPVTVLEETLCTAASESTVATPSAGHGTGGSGSIIDACVAAALEDERSAAAERSAATAARKAAAAAVWSKAAAQRQQHLQQQKQLRLLEGAAI